MPIPHHWEGNVHYYDYSPDIIDPYLYKDAWIVAKAWIYADDARHNLGILILFSGSDKLIDGVTHEQAISQATVLRDELISRCKEEVHSLTNNRVLIYSLRGEVIEIIK